VAIGTCSKSILSSQGDNRTLGIKRHIFMYLESLPNELEDITRKCEKSMKENLVNFQDHWKGFGAMK